MPIKVAVNGLGRIGRLCVKIAFDFPDVFELVSFNDIAAAESVAYLLQYDSVHGKWTHGAALEDGAIVLTDRSRAGRVVRVPYSTAPGPAGCVSYPALGVQLVLECTGCFLTRAELAPYFALGARKVIVSAPVKDSPAVLNVVYGVNDHLYDPASDHIVTAASCTTNCLAPVVKVVHERLGIRHGCITTAHSLTNTQSLVDAPNAKKSDLRRARSGLVNLAPTSTGSATAIALIFPELKGKLNGLAIRVPLTTASITDCVFEVARPTSVEEVNALLEEASRTYLAGILGFERVPLVSTDYVGDSRSSIVDAECTQVIDGTMVKIYSWYDNEFGYSSRMVDLARKVASLM